MCLCSGRGLLASPANTTAPLLPTPCRPPAAGSYLEGWGHGLSSGDVAAVFASPECECVLEGETRMGGQVRLQLLIS